MAAWGTAVPDLAMVQACRSTRGIPGDFELLQGGGLVAARLVDELLEARRDRLLERREERRRAGLLRFIALGRITNRMANDMMNAGVQVFCGRCSDAVMVNRAALRAHWQVL